MIVDRLVSFSVRLRAAGLTVPPQTTVTMVAALGHVDLTSAEDVRTALRGVVAHRPEQFPVFDRCFDAFFGAGTAAVPEEDEDPDADPIPAQAWTIRSPGSSDADDETDQEIADRVGASAIERLARRDFAEMDEADLEEARRLVAQMAWTPSEFDSRRWRPAKGGRRPDMRATLRNMVGPRSDLVPLEMSSRRPRRRPLVVIADVSGSMEAYAEMILTFAHAARARLGSVESFVFSTRLTRITWEMSRRDVRHALERVSLAVGDWSGGTKIGEALRQFNRDWSRRVCRGGPVLLIVSDGWDCGDPGVLEREMARLARSVHRVIWLNPLAGRAGYAPETRGMRTVLPHVDVFLPSATLVDLAEVIQLLESVARSPVARRPVSGHVEEMS